jgi:hypothetical protein
MHGVILVVPDVGIGEVVHYAIPDEQLGLDILGIVTVHQNSSTSGLVGMDFAEGRQFGVCLLIIGSELLEATLVVPMEMSPDHLIVMYGENITAALVVVPFEESNPSCHPIPGPLVLAEDGTTGPLMTDLLDASIKGGILTFQGSVVN